MGFVSKLFHRTIGQPHPVHPDDGGLIGDDDRRWFCSLTETDVGTVTQEDNVHRYAAFLKFKDEGFNAEDAARRCWRYFPYYYLDPSERGRNPLGFVGASAELPFLIKDKVNRLAIEGRITKAVAESHKTMTAAVRDVLQRRDGLNDEKVRGVEIQQHNAKEIDSGGESGEQDQALGYIAARIEPLQGVDRRFAARMLQAAWEIVLKFSDIPGAGFAERFAAASPEDSVRAYKAILGQLFFTFFLSDADARRAASRLLTDTTDEDLEHTIRLWVKFEECLNGEGAAADPRFNTAAIAWKSACEAIGADPSAEPVALLCFVAPWDAAMSELRGEFR